MGDGQHGRMHNTTANLAGQSYQLEPGTQLQHGRYVVEDVLGKGGMGHVYLVRDTHFGDPSAASGGVLYRALKEMIPRLAQEKELAPSIVNFTREAHMLVALRHPGIPTVYDSFTEFRRAYLVLDFVEGQTLEKVIFDSPTPLSQELVGSWMVRLCQIVGYLHTHKPQIIFRDLKPSNVMLTPDQRIVLIDFGIAKIFAGGEDQTNVGTNGYAAPEQYERRAESRSDIYSLGAMMHHLLTKTDPRYQAPFSFAERPVRTYNPQVSASVEAIVNRCLERAIGDRFQTVFELMLALEDALGMESSRLLRTATYGMQTTQHDLRHGAPAQLTGAPKLRWRFQTEQEVRSTPTASKDTLYIGSYDNNLYALDLKTGAWRWQFATDGGICGAPALWRDRVFVGSEDFFLYALSAQTGEKVWAYRTWHHVRSSPRIFEDRLYVGSDDCHLHSIDPRSGQPFWRKVTYREVQSSPAFAQGTVYFGSSDEYLYAVDAITGDKKWSHRAQAPIISSPTVVDGYVYFGCNDFSVYALDAKSGWLAWCESTDKFVISSPCVAGERLYVGSVDGHLYCLNRKTGSTVWKFDAGKQIISSPVVADGAVYFGGIDGYVYSVETATGKLRWRFQTGDPVPGSPLVRDGVVYIGSADGWVYALDAAG